MKKNFEKWRAELRSLLVEKFKMAETTEDLLKYDTADSWRDYYESGYSPEEAISEDFSYA